MKVTPDGSRNTVELYPTATEAKIFAIAIKAALDINQALQEAKMRKMTMPPWPQQGSFYTSNDTLKPGNPVFSADQTRQFLENNS